jgi:hypothetical protein
MDDNHRLLGPKGKLALTLVVSLLVFLFTLSVIIPSFSSIGSANNQNAATLSFSTPVDLSDPSANAVFPSIASVGSNVFVAWSEYSGGILFRSSFDAGSSFSPAVTISPSGGISQVPIVCAAGSAVYVTWSETVGTTGLQVLVAASKNRGSNFTVTQLSSGSPPNGWITPACAAAGSNAYITYASNQPTNSSWVVSTNDYGAHWSTPHFISASLEDQVAAEGNNAYAYANRALDVTHNGGASWNLVLANLTLLGDEGQIAAHGSYVYVTTQTKTNQSYVHVYYSSDYGNTWNNIQNLTTAIPDSWLPMVGTYGSSAWIALVEYPGGLNAQVWSYTTTNGGRVWNGPTSLSGTAYDETFPETVATSDGKNIFVEWTDVIRSGYAVLRVSYSSNGGGSWTAPPGIDVSQNSYGEAGFDNDLATASISASGTYCYAVWEYVNGSSDQVYFSTTAPVTVTSSSSTTISSSSSSSSSVSTSSSSSTSSSTFISSSSFSSSSSSYSSSSYSSSSTSSTSSSTSSSQSSSSSTLTFPPPSTSTAQQSSSQSTTTQASPSPPILSTTVWIAIGIVLGSLVLTSIFVARAGRSRR